MGLFLLQLIIQFKMDLTLINKKGAVDMEVKTITRKSMKLIGIEKKVSYHNTHVENPIVWKEFMSRYKEIRNKVNPKVYFELLSETANNLSFNTCFCTEVSDTNDIPDGMTTKELPESKYLVFTHKGAVISENRSFIKETYDYIYGKYLPNSEYEVSGDYSFELFDSSRFKGPRDSNSEIDIYIPIK